MNPYNVSGFYNPAPWDYLQEIIDAKQRQLRQIEAACYDDIAAAIRNHFPGIEITGAQVAGRVNELLIAEEKLQRSDCRICGQERFCQYTQGAHSVVRINCPLWRPKKGGPHEKR